MKETKLEHLANNFFMLKRMEAEGAVVKDVLKTTWEEYVAESHLEVDRKLADQKARIEVMFNEKRKER